MIVQTLNDAYGTEFTPEDKVDLQQIHQRITEDEELLSALMADNTLADMRSKCDQVLDAVLLEFVQIKLDLFKKSLRAQWKPGVEAALV